MKKAVILDTSAIMYRNHYALKNMRNSKGMSTGATYGFVNTLEAILREFEPDYIVACLDVKRSELKRSDVALLVVEIEKEAERDFPYVLNLRYGMKEEDLLKRFGAEVLEELRQAYKEYSEKLSSISKNLLNEVIETLPKEE